MTSRRVRLRGRPISETAPIDDPDPRGARRSPVTSYSHCLCETSREPKPKGHRCLWLFLVILLCVEDGGGRRAGDGDSSNILSK